MAVIAMTREMATRGKDVSVLLAERLGLTIVHHELIEHDIAERAGLRESEVHHLLEGEASLRERLKLDRKRLSQFTAEEILELASKGSVLIRGWGATYLLRTIPHVVCVRICAPMPYREAVLMERHNIKDVSIARAEILRSDAAHNAIVTKLFGADWRDPTLYALVLNTARVPIADCVEHIVRLVESPSFQPTTQSLSTLSDKVIEARVRAALNAKFGMSMLSPAITVSVADGKVQLIGGASDTHLIVDAIRTAQAVEGVTGVENKIALITFGSY